MNLTASVSIGNGIIDSLLLAKFNSSNIADLPLEALRDVADPFGRDPVVQKYVEKLILAFADLGIRSIGAFQKVPIKELTSRFGSVGILCRQRLTGEFSIPWPYWAPEEIISERFEFPHFEFYGELEPVLFELKKQLDQIFQRLWARALKAQSLEVKIYCETNSINPVGVLNFKFDFLLPQSTTKGALNIIRERLSKEFERTPIKTPIERLETFVTSFAPGGLGQKDMFSNQEETAEQLSSLLSQLAESCGQENIFHAELTEDRLPEKSWIRCFAIPSETKAFGASVVGKIPLRPTHLLKPERVEITENAVFIRKKSFRILKWQDDIERIAGGWLDNDTDHFKLTHERNYYQIEIETGMMLSVFQVPSQEYFLHGYFG
jgi:hypothetical protein